VYVDGVKVVPISLMQALKVLSDIYDAKLADKLCELLLRQYLRESISRHTISRDPLNVDTRGGDLLSDPELVDVNVFDLCMKLVVLLRNNTDSLLIVTPDCRCKIELEIDARKESHPLLHLRGS
jgi:hypothetical protein